MSHPKPKCHAELEIAENRIFVRLAIMDGTKVVHSGAFMITQEIWTIMQSVLIEKTDFTSETLTPFRTERSKKNEDPIFV